MFSAFLNRLPIPGRTEAVACPIAAVSSAEKFSVLLLLLSVLLRDLTITEDAPAFVLHFAGL